MGNPKHSATVAKHNLGASFRDPAGFIYKNERGELLRQINHAGAEDFDMLLASGLYDALVEQDLLVSHRTRPAYGQAHAVIQPAIIPFISYPFEWSFSQLQDAAQLTLTVQKLALTHGMTLKDASAYNVQLMQGRPIFIDTLSFEKYVPGTPWQAYRQFCQHFLAPLALMAYTDTDLSQLLRVQLDGIRLELATKLLPSRAKVRPGLAMHIVLHGKAQKAKQTEHKRPQRQVSQSGLVGILESLERTVRGLHPHKMATEWGDYYDKTNYTAGAADRKAQLITKFVKPLQASTALDLGSNNGLYSRVLNNLGITTVCTDIDPNAVEANYRFAKQHAETRMLPLLVDLTNPGGALGWQNQEREAVHKRLRCDVVMALALIHHLAISNNLPFASIAEYFSKFGPCLLVEFVPKDDSQVQKLLATRKDIFSEYTERSFKDAFGNYYTLRKEAKIAGSKRTLYLFERKT